MKRLLGLCLLFASILTVHCGFFAEPAADITLPSLFSDNMVFQQQMPAPVWGTATPGGKVTVIFADRRKSTVVDATGKWRVNLNPTPVGGPFTLKIIGKDTLEFANVMVGEVWVCSGQSNMEMPLAGWGQVLDFEAEIADAEYPNIRLFQVQHATSLNPQDDVPADGWMECSPNTVGQFSATAYFFGRHLHKELEVPIGLIHTSWGGTIAEAWTAPEFLAQMADFAPFIEQLKTKATTEAEIRAEYERQVAEWQQLVNAKVAEAQSGESAWEKSDLNDTGWKKMTLPVLWENAGLPGFDGFAWFRKTIDLAAEAANANFTLSLGPIDDQDITFINGNRVGSIDGYNTPREYAVPSGLLKAGANVIAVQVLDTGGGGGIWGEAGQMWLRNDVGDSINLAGEWKYKAGVSLADVPPRPVSPDNPNQPAVLYNAMLKPLMPFGIAGAIWYQGESNAGRAYQYRELFPKMIESWRFNWGQGDFPFLFVQLANWRATRDIPAESDWAELREAQTQTLAVPNTGMAVAIDIGDAVDIHPKNKQEVGRRLALNALSLVYADNIVFSGPMYKSMFVEGDKIRLTFGHIGSGLVADGDELTGFAIAGADKKFVWAEAVIDSETVVVSSPQVPNPVAVRYAWADNPVCNLYNEEGLPASPFRTDEWDGITKGVK